MSADERSPMSATRRALITAAIAAPTLPAAAFGQTLLGHWRDYRRTEADINAGRHSDDEAMAVHCVKLTQLENRIIDAPIHTKDDALAKLLIACLSIEKGDRSDGADQRAVDQVVAWLEAH